MPSSEQSDIEYPLLGEPVLIEFLNTLYCDPDGTFDFLGDVALTQGWFQALAPSILDDPGIISESDRQRFVKLRNGLRDLFDPSAASELATVITMLESAVNASPARVQLIATSEHRVVADKTFDTQHPAGALAQLADAAITIVTSSSSLGVLICDRPGCNMRYWQHHRRRRYCNPACANSDRQTRFQQRQKK